MIRYTHSRAPKRKFGAQIFQKNLKVIAQEIRGRFRTQIGLPRIVHCLSLVSFGALAYTIPLNIGRYVCITDMGIMYSNFKLLEGFINCVINPSI